MQNYNKIPDCYIYLYHTDECFLIPQYPDTVQDSLSSTFGSQNALSRTAPVYSYSNSGPRTIQVNFKLHRDLMYDLNINSGMIHYKDNNETITTPKDDYVDILIKRLQAIALPKYNTKNSMVEPPMVAVQLCNDIFIKGVVDGGISIAYDGPVLENNKYAQVTISFTVSEILPYDAISVGRLGSRRGFTKTTKDKMFPNSDDTNYRRV